MTILSVNYDLRKPGRDYNGLYEVLKKAPSWWHYLGSTWLVYTDQSPETWFKLLAPHLDTNDSMLIIEVTANHAGWLPKKAWEWITEHMALVAA